MGYVGVSRNDWYIPQIAMLIHFHREADDSEMDERGEFWQELMNALSQGQ